MDSTRDLGLWLMWAVTVTGGIAGGVVGYLAWVVFIGG